MVLCGHPSPRWILGTGLLAFCAGADVLQAGTSQGGWPARCAAPDSTGELDPRCVQEPEAPPLSLLQIVSAARRRGRSAAPQAKLADIEVTAASEDDTEASSATLPGEALLDDNPPRAPTAAALAGLAPQGWTVLPLGFPEVSREISQSEGASSNSPAVVSLLWLLGVLIMSLVVYTLTSQGYGMSQNSNFFEEGEDVAKAWAPPQLRGRLRPARAVEETAGSSDVSSKELPVIYPPLLMPVAHTRLAIPIDPLMDPEFELDVLGLSGVPLLSASLMSASGRRNLRIMLHNSAAPLASVTPNLKVLSADGSTIGTLSKNADEEFELRDKDGQRVLFLAMASPDEVKMVTLSGGRRVDRAQVTRRSAGRLPADHYEVVVSPGVDSVLVVACFLGVAVFALPSGR